MRHVTVITRLMGMKVVFHVHLMNVVLRIQPPLPSHLDVLFVVRITNHVVLVKQDTTIQEGYAQRFQKEGMEGCLLE